MQTVCICVAPLNFTLGLPARILSFRLLPGYVKFATLQSDYVCLCPLGFFLSPVGFFPLTVARFRLRPSPIAARQGPIFAKCCPNRMSILCWGRSFRIQVCPAHFGAHPTLTDPYRS